MGNFSPQTIEALAMTITGGSFSGSANPVPSKYRAGWELEQFFKGIEVSFQIDNRSRVPAVRECLEDLNISNPAKIEEAIQAICDPREYLDEEDDLREIVVYLNKRLKFDGFELWEEGGFYRLVSTDIVGAPANALQASEVSGDIKQILSGLISVASGIGALRTHSGDAHGRGRKRVPVDARIARLAIHAASTVSLFYIETWNRITAAKKRNDKEARKSDPKNDD